MHFLPFFLDDNIGIYRGLLLKLFVWSFSWENVFFFKHLIIRKLSLFDRLNTISGIALANMGFDQ